MATPTSGSISVGDLRTEFRIPYNQPISLSQFYRNGSFVKDSVTLSTITREPTDGSYLFLEVGTIQSYWEVDVTMEHYVIAKTSSKLVWKGSTILSPTVGEDVDTRVIGGWTYAKGAEMSDGWVSGDYTSGLYRFRYQIRRFKTATSQVASTANRNVPRTGAISLNHLRGVEYARTVFV